jgi:hypothetical protein
MKKVTKEELQKNASRLMDAHKTDKVFATQDGNYFLTQAAAIFHNNEIKKGDREWDGEIIPFEKSEPVKEGKPVESEELKAAKARAKSANKNLADKKKAMDAADKKAEKKPDDEGLKKAAADAKAEYEAAQLEVDNAKTALDALSTPE